MANRDRILELEGEVARLDDAIAGRRRELARRNEEHTVALRDGHAYLQSLTNGLARGNARARQAKVAKRDQASVALQGLKARADAVRAIVDGRTPDPETTTLTAARSEALNELQRLKQTGRPHG